MYLSRLTLINSGPIAKASIDCEFNADGSPKPVILVGQNGSGKSIALAHIVNAFISAHAFFFDDAEIERGKVYKLRSAGYIKYGCDHSIGQVHFCNGFYVNELQLADKKSQFKERTFDYPNWDKMPNHANSDWSSNISEKGTAVEDTLRSEIHLYFPPNRFEEPAWLNEVNLKNRVEYTSLKRFSNISNKPVVLHAPMRDIQSWLLDLIYDSFAVERKFRVEQSNNPDKPPYVMEKRDGVASNLLTAIEDVLKEIFDKQGDFKWHIGARNDRAIGFEIDKLTVSNNIFGLSTGQTALLDLFLSIIRGFDIGSASIAKLADIRGVVVVDEIDLHLHTDLQHNVLPRLLKLFPFVQFIVTTHSPLFVTGIQKTHGAAGIQIIEFPEGNEIEAERFSEFESAYKYMKESATFQNDIRERVSQSQKPLLYVEGTTDIDYIRKAARLLEKEDVLDKFEMIDAVGQPHLNKIWDTYKSHLNSAIRQKSVLLYDCDTGKPDDQIGRLYRRRIPEVINKIETGIENLFPENTIKKAISFKAAFIDIDSARSVTVRGEEQRIEEKWKVNAHEKRNLCDWICANGDGADFVNFDRIFRVLEEVLEEG